MASGLAGKVVIVTGAAHGVGLAAARGFVRAGAWVMMADIDERRLEAEVEAVGAAGFDGRVQGFVGDLRQKLTMTNLMAETIATFEGLDVLVNASRLLVASDPLDPAADRLDEVLAQNVAATLRLSQIAARRMTEFAAAGPESGSDRAIVNLSSVFARRALPELLAFSVGCAALEQLTRTLALALAEHRIRVNAVAVGGLMGRSIGAALAEIDDLPDALAEAVPLGRLGEPREVAEAILFLASPAASFVTGQILAADGGSDLLDPLDISAAV